MDFILETQCLYFWKIEFPALILLDRFEIQQRQYKLVKEVLGHLKDGGVVIFHPAAGEDEAGGGVGQVVRERHVDVESGA